MNNRSPEYDASNNILGHSELILTLARQIFSIHISQVNDFPVSRSLNSVLNPLMYIIWIGIVHENKARCNFIVFVQMNFEKWEYIH